MEESGGVRRERSRACPPQTSRECPIRAVGLRQHAKSSAVERGCGHDTLRRWLESELAALGEEGIYLRVVLLGLERARAVDEQSAGPHDVGCRAEDGALQGSEHREVRR